MPSPQHTTAPPDRSVVAPTHQDEVAAAGSELIGGPVGRWARPGGSRLSPCTSWP